MKIVLEMSFIIFAGINSSNIKVTVISTSYPLRTLNSKKLYILQRMLHSCVE